MNDATRVARRFHDRTTHTPASVRSGTHYLDWDVKPFPFKVYSELPPIPLPREWDPVDGPTLRVMGRPPAAEGGRPAPATLTTLAALLYYAAGVTKKKTYPGSEMLFRAAASTGALYQTEVYAAVGDVEGLAPGLYHFNPGDFALRRLREGDVRGALARAAADESLARRAVTVVLSAIYWRNTWKYQARGYRHLFWDSGTMLANLLAVAGALGLAPRLLVGFVDAAVNHLLGLDPAHEAALELVALGRETAPAPDAGPPPAIGHPILPLSSSEVDYPELREMHRASMLDDPEAVAAWRAAAGRIGAGSRDAEDASRPAGEVIGLPAPPPEESRGLGETIQRRGSTREFGAEPLTRAELGAALAAAARGVDADVPPGLVDLYLVVNAVEGVAPGAYAYRPEADGLELLRPGDFRAQSAYLCLEQPLGGDAAAVVYFLAPLDAVLAALGDRGYRVVNLEAGLAGGRAYLAAYALGFGASGLTFYDRHVVEFFSPHAEGKDAIFVTALGRAARDRRDTIGRIPTVRRRADR
jgi:SagB-type dehydrogenase family enzyme